MAEETTTETEQQAMQDSSGKADLLSVTIASQQQRKPFTKFAAVLRKCPQLNVINAFRKKKMNWPANPVTSVAFREKREIIQIIQAWRFGPDELT